MKDLLHSRKFKDNLCKWLFCYISFIAMFTIVVTYSRYISTVSSSDSARAAKFEVTIKNLTDCTENSYFCNLGSIRTQRENEFLFSVDTTNLEVATRFFTDIYVDSRFTVEEIQYKDETTNGIFVTANSFIVNSNKIEIREDIEANNGYNRQYRLICTYNQYETNYADGTPSAMNSVVTVEYAATQIN